MPFRQMQVNHPRFDAKSLYLPSCNNAAFLSLVFNSYWDLPMQTQWAYRQIERVSFSNLMAGSELDRRKPNAEVNFVAVKAAGVQLCRSSRIAPTFDASGIPPLAWKSSFSCVSC
jgi:hypothetical protein